MIEKSDLKLQVVLAKGAELEGGGAELCPSALDAALVERLHAGGALQALRVSPAEVEGAAPTVDGAVLLALRQLADGVVLLVADVLVVAQIETALHAAPHQVLGQKIAHGAAQRRRRRVAACARLLVVGHGAANSPNSRTV